MWQNDINPNIHMSPPNLLFLNNGLNGTATVFLQGWFWHEITQEIWYAVKQRNQTKPTKPILLFWIWSTPDVANF